LFFLAAEAFPRLSGPHETAPSDDQAAGRCRGLVDDHVAAGDDDIGPALERYARLPGYDPAPADLDQPSPERPAKSLVRLDAHIGQAARRIDEFFGYDQWFLFDTRWAAAHPDLARSLLRYAAQRDPLAA
jgi:hypothetical protein